MIGDLGFLHRFDPLIPLTEDARDALADASDLDVADTTVHGLIVLTQTCDIVRSCVDRPYLEVSPLVQVSQTELGRVSRGAQPRFAFVPGVADKGLVADLDRVMTVEKALALHWERTAGCRTDEERRLLAAALARKRQRFAFPDDFVAWVRPLQDRLTKKHAKSSDEGQSLRALREIRVRASPSWDADRVSLHFLFIRGEDEQGMERGSEEWDRQVAAWMEKLNRGGEDAPIRFVKIDGSALSLDDLSAREYTESDPLDLYHLSAAAE